MLNALADHEQLALEGILVRALAGDEDLTNNRLAVLGGLGESTIVARHIAPAEESLTFFVDYSRQRRFAGSTAIGRLRQEDVATTVAALRRQLDAELRRLGAQKGVGHLDQDAGAVAEQRIVSGRPSVREVLENLQALLDDRVALAILDMSDKADAAGVVFMGGVVEPLPARYVHFGIPGMRTSKKAGGRRPSVALPGFASLLDERINIPQNTSRTQYPWPAWVHRAVVSAVSVGPNSRACSRIA